MIEFIAGGLVGFTITGAAVLVSLAWRSRNRVAAHDPSEWREESFLAEPAARQPKPNGRMILL